MRSAARLVLFGASASACALASCLSFDELQGGGANANDAGDATAASDSSSDALASDDSSSNGEAGSDGGCPLGTGPGMVQITDVTPPFCVDRTEVTNAQYGNFLQANVPTTGQPSPVCDSNSSYTPQNKAGTTNLWPLPGSAAAYPVANVDWCDATAYCKWAGKRLCGRIGGGSNLVSDHADANKSQWYHACSHDGTLIYPYGSSYMPLACNGRDFSDGGASVPAGSLATCIGGYPGLRDMAGNVEEWTDSCDDAGCLSLGGSFVDFGPDNVEMCGDNSQDDPPMNRSGDIGFRCCGD